VWCIAPSVFEPEENCHGLSYQLIEAQSLTRSFMHQLKLLNSKLLSVDGLGVEMRSSVQDKVPTSAQACIAPQRAFDCQCLFALA